MLINLDHIDQSMEMMPFEQLYAKPYHDRWIDHLLLGLRVNSGPSYTLDSARIVLDLLNVIQRLHV